MSNLTLDFDININILILVWSQKEHFGPKAIFFIWSSNDEQKQKQTKILYLEEGMIRISYWKNKCS